MRNAGISIDALSTDTGMSVSGIKKWLYGQAEPGLCGVVQCAKVLGVSVQWLATGDETDDIKVAELASRVATDPELMGKINDAISRIYKDNGGRINPSDMGRMAAKWYDLVVRIDPDPVARTAALTILAAQLKDELSAPIGVEGNSKRRA